MNQKTLKAFPALILSAWIAFHISSVYADGQKDGKRWAVHSLEYNVLTDENKDIELLNYQYGDSDSYPNGDPKIHGIRPSASQLQTGHIKQGISIHGGMPVADYLYVKWRVLPTGQEQEDKVDLKNLLPSDMEHKTVHFGFDGTKLYVYVITELEHSTGKDCPLKLYKDRGCTRIYPDHWSNF